MAQENRNHATNAVPAQDVSAGSFKSGSIVSRPGVNLLNMTEGEHVSHLSGYLSGVLVGIDIGREQMEAELAAIQRHAHGIVQAMAKLLPWEEAQEVRRQHQVQSAEHHRAAGQPWPLEVAS